MKTFFNELKDRNVVRVGAVYLGTAWLITHVGTILGENFEFPHWVMRSVIVFLALGFPVALGIAWVYEATPEGLKRTGEAASGRSIAQVTGRKLDRLIILVLALVVAALIADRFVLHESVPGRLVLPWSGEATVYGTAIVIGVVALLAATLIFARMGRKRRTASASATAASPAATLAHADERVSLAVLPFVNMSSDPEQEYFSDGLSEELMNKLSQVKKLRVAARTSCFAFKGQNTDVKIVGEKLGVAHVLEGSVRKAGNRLRITAQLIDCADGSHLWSNTFDRELDDVFAIQENVARTVAQALGVTLGIGETVRAPGGTSNLEAYDLYLRARALNATLAPPDLKRSLDVYRKALALDPEFALAWAGLAGAIPQSFIFYPETINALRPEMEAAFARASKLAPDLPEINVGRAYLSWVNYDWAGAEKCLAGWDGHTGDPLGIFSYLLGVLGRLQDAVKHQTLVCQADPLAIGVSFNLQFLLDYAGHFEEAEAEYERSKDLAGNRATIEWRAVTRLMARRDARFEQRFADIIADGQSWMAFDPQLLKVLDEPEEALKIIRAALDEPDYQDGARMGAIAHWAEHYGDRDLAFKALRRGFVEMHGLTVIEIWCPVFSELRRDPRFKDLVRDIGLVDHWRKTGNWGDHARPVGKDDFEVW